jgi:protein-tyrosine-phosphatase
MNRQKIKFVCTGNNARSPLAETVARGRLCSNYASLSDSILICSSGTQVEQSQAKMLSREDIKFLLERGHRYNSVSPILYSADETARVERILREDEARGDYDSHYRESVKRLALRTLAHFKKDEARLRDVFLRRIGLEYLGAPQQTKASSNVDLILPVAASNREQVLNIYAAAGLVPTIEVLSDYARMAAIVNPFGSPFEEEVIACFELVKKASEAAVDRFVEETYESK